MYMKRSDALKISCNQANNHFLIMFSHLSFAVVIISAFVRQLSVMAALYVKELEEKVARYEAVMSRCPRCKSTLPPPKADSTGLHTRHSRSSRSAQQPAAKVPPPAPAGPSKRSVPTSTLRSSARVSKQLHPGSRAEPQASSVQQNSLSVQSAAQSSQSHQTSEVPIAPLRRPLMNLSDDPKTGSVPSSAPESTRQPTTSSQAPTTYPSSIPPSNAGVRQPRSGSSDALNVLQYKKPEPPNRMARPSEQSNSNSKWIRMAEIMLEEVPSGRHWREKVAKMDSSIMAAVALGVAPGLEGEVCPTEDVRREKLVQRVRRFAQRHSEGRVNFEHLILVCLCQVMASQGVPRDEIVETLQICISDTSQQNILRYLRGAIWVNEMVNELFFTDWSYRAVDLISICKVVRDHC